MPEAHDEHRGWEISDDYEQHCMDDGSISLGPGLGSPVGFIVALIVLALSGIGFYALNLYLAPPQLTFPHYPSPVISNVAPGSIVLPPGTKYFAFAPGTNTSCTVKQQDAKHATILCSRP